MNPPIESADDAWTKAVQVLHQGESVDFTSAPIPIVHCGYYAMHHAARAALIRATGRAPVRHDKVLQAFGYLAHQAGDESLKAAGHDLKLRMGDRLVADYEGGTPDADEARTAIDSARRFLAVCADRFGFDPP